MEVANATTPTYASTFPTTVTTQLAGVNPCFNQWSADAEICKVLEVGGVFLSSLGQHRLNTLALSEKLEITVTKALKETLAEQLISCTKALQGLPILNDDSISDTLVQFLPINTDLAKTASADIRTLHQPIVGIIAAAICRLATSTSENHESGSTTSTPSSTDDAGFTLVSRRRRNPERTRIDGKIVVTVKTLEELRTLTAPLGPNLLYHGTTLSSALDILDQGLLLRKQRKRNELSREKAFYTTSTLEFAVNNAHEKYSIQNVDDIDDDDNAPALVMFSKPDIEICGITDEMELKKLVYNNATFTDRYSIPQHILDADVLSGLICVGMNHFESYEDVRLFQDAIQYAFKQNAIGALHRSLRREFIIRIHSTFPIPRPET